jgi:vacuolar-type H+-ATPase subunit H
VQIDEYPALSRRIDILSLLDQLQDLIVSSHRVPLSDRIVVNQDALLDLVDAIRDTLPHDVIEAERVLGERHRLLSDARDRADQMLEDAREQSSYLLDEHHVVRAAELRAEKRLNEAEREADGIIASAEEYVQKLFGRFEQEALQLADEIRTAAARSH